MVHLVAVVESVWEVARWGQTVVYREDRDAQLVGPHTGVVLMRAGTHCHETTPVYMHYHYTFILKRFIGIQGLILLRHSFFRKMVINTVLYTLYTFGIRRCFQII